jgi:hypothetical protein
MPATVLTGPLRLACVFSDGTAQTWQVAVERAPDTLLTADLVTGLAGLIHPHGSIDQPSTAHKYLLAATMMARWLAEHGFTSGAARLTRAALAEFWMATTSTYEAKTRAMLTAFDDATGSLRREVREMVTGRHFNTQFGKPPLAPYSEAEWAAIHKVCGRVVTDAYARHRQARAAAHRGTDPRDGGWTRENVAWLLAQVGPSTSDQIGELMGVCGNAILARGFLTESGAALFPPIDVTIGYRLLFGVHTGIVPDGIDALGLADIEWAGDATVLLDYVKGRTSKESLTLAPRAVRLLQQWLDHSALLRRFTPPDQQARLWLRHVPNAKPAIRGDPVNPESWRSFTRRHQLHGDDGQPLRVHLHRVRTTFVTMRDRRTWFGSGRALIDPNHSPRVEGDRYLSVATPAQRQAVDTIIDEAQHDLLRKARPPAVLDTEHAADAAARLPQLVAELNLTDAVVAELVGGARDVFAAACTDPLSGLHGPPGKPCPARPWVCLLCPLAVFTTRHAANLLRLKAFFARQGRQLTVGQFIAVFGPYAARIDEVLGCFDPAVLAAAAAVVADRDDEIPLRPEEATT